MVSCPSFLNAENWVAEKITTGQKHHFFGYIGPVQTIPWNASGRYIVALRVEFQNRLPGANDAAEIVLLDAKHDYAVCAVDTTRAWNPQQGTMLYWNPQTPETEFFLTIAIPKLARYSPFALTFHRANGVIG